MNPNQQPGPPPPEDAVFETNNVTALESISRAEVDIAISTARRYPRSLSMVKKSMLSFATLDEETAASCFYTLPRGGKNIQGPSVRLAEIAVSCYQNLRAGSRILQTVTDGPNPHVVVQAVAMDLENNVSVSIEKRRRITKKKNKDHIDEDDINLAANAGSAIAFRDAVFKVIPLALIKPVFEQAKMVAIGDAKTLADRRAKCIESFGKMGIGPDRIFAKLEKKGIEEIGLEDIETLIGLFNAIKEGEVQPDEAFPAPTPAGTAKTPEFTSPGAAKQETAKTPPKDTPKDTPKPPIVPTVKAPEQPKAPPTPPTAPAAAPVAPTPTPQPEPPKAPPVATEPTPVPLPAAAEPPASPAGASAAPVDEVAAKALSDLKSLMAGADATEEKVIAFCVARKICKPEQKKLSDLSAAKLTNLVKAWPNISGQMK